MVDFDVATFRRLQPWDLLFNDGYHLQSNFQKSQGIRKLLHGKNRTKKHFYILAFRTAKQGRFKTILFLPPTLYYY